MSAESLMPDAGRRIQRPIGIFRLPGSHYHKPSPLDHVPLAVHSLIQEYVVPGGAYSQRFGRRLSDRLDQGGEKSS